MTELTTIAANMTDEAKRRGVDARTLPRGLMLRLAWVGGYKTLILSREFTRPSEQEIVICRRAFQVPDDAGRTDGDLAVTLRWPADEQPAAEDPQMELRWPT